MVAVKVSIPFRRWPLSNLVKEIRANLGGRRWRRFQSPFGDGRFLTFASPVRLSVTQLERFNPLSEMAAF